MVFLCRFRDITGFPVTNRFARRSLLSRFDPKGSIQSLFTKIGYVSLNPVFTPEYPRLGDVNVTYRNRLYLNYLLIVSLTVLVVAPTDSTGVCHTYILLRSIRP